MITDKLRAKLKNLPAAPGVYFHKNANDEIIYVGKAAVLKNRVRQYFQNTTKDPKTNALVQEIVDTDWRVVDSEIDALFLESELIKRYQPKWNILLRDDKTVSYVKVSLRNPIPTVEIIRTPVDDGSVYVGPFYGHQAIEKALRTLRRTFPYFTNTKNTSRLNTHLKLEPDLGSDLKNPDAAQLKEYRKNLRRLILYLENGRQTLMKSLEKEMQTAAKAQDFEAAAKLRNQLSSLKELQRKIVFSDQESLNLSKDQALEDLKNILNLENPPRRIEGYDISHHGGENAVASMVVFTNGVADRSAYRKFKIKESKNNDFANMREVLTRRIKHHEWPKPDLILIDGGTPQLRAVGEILENYGVPYLGLAERFETVITKNGELPLPKNSHLTKLLIRVRDEAHRFAITYHSYLKRKNMLK